MAKGRVFVVIILLLVSGALAPSRAGAASATCRKVVLTGEVNAGHEWRIAIGEGWAFRVVPIAAGEKGYTGWDLVMDRDTGGAVSGGYPDALLVATPPYGSLNEREIGTTYGLRAQDAIAWGPRRFHFLTTDKDLARGRELFATVMGKAGQSGTNSAASAEELLRMVSDPAHVGTGEFAVQEARLVPGTADPAPFARQWAARLGQVPHTNLQSSGVETPRGELRWIRFTATLWVPGNWRVAPTLHPELVKCAK